MSSYRSSHNTNSKIGRVIVITFAVIPFLFYLLTFFVQESDETKGWEQNKTSHREQTEAARFGFKNWAANNWQANAESNVRNGLVTEIAENTLAKNYYIILDTSGSMNEYECALPGQTKLDVAKESLGQWIKNISSNDNIALMVFRDKQVSERLPLGRNTPAYTTQFLETLSEQFARGGTPLGKALEKAYYALESQARKQLKYGEYNIVVVTDGAASDRRAMEAVTQKMFKSSPIRLHTIGFCIQDNHALNQPNYAYYVSAMNTSQLANSLQGVLAESETFNNTGFEHIKP